LGLTEALGGRRYWRMQNGYTFSEKADLEELGKLITPGNREKLKSTVRVGLQTGAQVVFKGINSRRQPVRLERLSPPQLVSQVFCSAISCCTAPALQSWWRPLAKLVLEASYEATLWSALLNAVEKGNKKVFLTFVGGGAFMNDMKWIVKAIAKAVATVERMCKNATLDVMVVHYRVIDDDVVKMVEEKLRIARQKIKRSFSGSAIPRPLPPADKKVVLVDMNGVIANFELQFLRLWKARYPGERWIPLAKRRNHYTDKDPSKIYDSARTHAILEAADELYGTMPSIEGAIEALREMDKHPQINVKICSAPFGRGDIAERCKAAKRKWIRKHLGAKWLSKEKFICVKNKMTVPGYLLVDDKPDPSKHWSIQDSPKSAPTWRHVVFTQPFNKKHIFCQNKPRLNHWSKWKSVLLPLLSKSDGGRLPTRKHLSRSERF